VPDTTWDGLTHLYGEFWQAAGRPQARYHLRWIAALGG
jgi:hypothetical protein